MWAYCGFWLSLVSSGLLLSPLLLFAVMHVGMWLSSHGYTYGCKKIANFSFRYQKKKTQKTIKH